MHMAKVTNFEVINYTSCTQDDQLLWSRLAYRKACIVSKTNFYGYFN